MCLIKDAKCTHILFGFALVGRKSTHFPLIISLLAPMLRKLRFLSARREQFAHFLEDICTLVI